MKSIVFDASTLISFSMNGLYDVLEKLRGIFDGKFLITKEVRYEIIDRPITIKKFELEALYLKQLIEKKVFELPSSLGIDEKEISNRTQKVLEVANSSFYSGRENIKILDLGEASCMALSRMLDEKKISSIMAVDERTMRMLGEKPENLSKLLSDKLHTSIKPNRENFNFFKSLKFVRSAELVYVAYKKNLIKLGNGDLLDALLYAVKFKGCAISNEEIEEIKRMK
ncbi:MAG: hypothetical protein AABW50_05865 [Nanoarchaeota archaeon]